MPIYEYYCKHCDIEFEKLVLNKDEVVKCPKCGKTDVERVFSSFGTKSGWDFRMPTGRQKKISSS